MTAPQPVTIIVQSRVRAGKDDEFGRWQARIGAVAARQPGFLEQSVLPPDPPTQVDWVILQRFADSHSALAWLSADARLAVLAEGEALLTGVDDVHLVADLEGGARPAPVSIVFSTRLKPGGEPEFRAWQQRVCKAQAAAPGFQGYRFEAPVPGVQEDWLGTLRFDSEANLQLWLDSPIRQALVQEAEAFTQEYRARITRTGFEPWFDRGRAQEEPPAAWKQNMLVLALLYPLVVLFGLWVQTPVLMGWLGWPLWLALFVGNAASVWLLSRLVPMAMGGLGWWLRPAAARRRRVDLAGAALMAAWYAACLLVFSRLG